MDSNNINISSNDNNSNDDTAESISTVSVDCNIQKCEYDEINEPITNEMICTIEIETGVTENKDLILNTDSPTASPVINNESLPSSTYVCPNTDGSTANIDDTLQTERYNLAYNPTTDSPTAQNPTYNEIDINSYVDSVNNQPISIEGYFLNGAQQHANIPTAQINHVNQINHGNHINQINHGNHINQINPNNPRHGPNHHFPHHSMNFNHPNHYYNNYHNNHVNINQRSPPISINGGMSPHRHHYNGQQSNLPSYYNSVSTTDPNFFINNGHTFDYVGATATRPLSPHLMNMATIRNHQSHSNMIHYNNTPIGNGRYSHHSLNNNMMNASDALNSEMVSVTNTSTNSTYANENVCTQINNILSQSTKDHQAIVMATKSSNNNLSHDRNGNSVQLGGYPNGFYMLEKDDVNEILRAAGYDADNLYRPTQLITHHHNVHQHQDFGTYNSYPRRSHVTKSNSNQMFSGDSDIASTGVSRSNHGESQSERNSVSNQYNFNPNAPYRTNDPYLNSQKTVDFDLSEFEHLQNSIRSGAIDLSISSDEDHRNMEFGPVGSDPRKIHIYQQQINQTPLPTNENNPTAVRRRSQNGTVSSSVQVSFNQTLKSGLSQSANTLDTSESDMTQRTRSMGDSSDIQSLIDVGVMNALSDLSIDRDFPDFQQPIPTSHTVLCVHNVLKNFCTICQYESPPPIPFESVITRMSAASTSSYTMTTPAYSYQNSSRSSACEIRPISDSPRSSRHTHQPQFNNNNNIHNNIIHNNNHNNNGVNKMLSHHNKVENIVNVGGGSKKDVFSRKVFVGGLPQDITETQIALEFKRFGELVVDWPHKLDSNSGLPPKGYAFLLFEQSESVVNLISRCSKVDEKFFWAVSSQRSESKQVQIRPWTITDAIWSSRDPIEKPVPRCKRTVFVGGIPRQAQARELFENMNHCFGGVGLVEIDVDLEYSYPKGAASVTFDNNQCYLKALEAHFISLKLCGMEKRVEIKPFFSDDQHCEDCGIQMNSRNSGSNPNHQNGGNTNQPIGQYFCVDKECLKYFCENCWTPHQEENGHMQPPQNKSNGYHRQFQFRRASSHSNYNNNNSKSSN